MHARPYVLRSAASVIKTGGLHKGWYRHGAAHCTIGSLLAVEGVELVAPGNTLSIGQVELTYGKVLTELVGEADVAAVQAWNDLPETTAEDVATVLEQAAEKLAAETGAG